MTRAAPEGSARERARRRARSKRRAEMQADGQRRIRPLYPRVGVLAGLILLVTATWAADFTPGDMNNDGAFDLLDPTVLRRELADLGPGVTQICFAELPATGP